MHAATRHPSLSHAIRWIADNDEPELDEDDDLADMEGLISVMLVADIWGLSPEDVAKRVIAQRQRRK